MKSIRPLVVNLNSFRSTTRNDTRIIAALCVVGLVSAVLLWGMSYRAKASAAPGVNPGKRARVHWSNDSMRKLMNSTHGRGPLASYLSPLAPGTCDASPGGNVEVEGTGGTAATQPFAYSTLTAAFAAINSGGHTGPITIDVCGDTSEGTGTALLNASGTGAASYTTITMSPAGGATRTISGTSAAGSPMIDLSGADNVTIDGLNAGGNSLTLSNAQTGTTAGTSTIRLINDATSNTIQNTTVNGAATGSSTGNIIFSTTTGTTGNDNNTITACNIGPVGATFPTNGIFSSGTTTSLATRNSGIQITNNNIFDFYNTGGTVANGVIASGSTDWTITGNSFYQTAPRIMATASGFIGISIADTSGVNFVVSNNFVGGSAASAGGTSWTQTGATTHTFIGIRMSVGTTTASSLQNNTIRNISITTSSASTVSSGISAVTGAMNIGTTTGNTIGSAGGTGSITWTGAGTAARFSGISAGTGTPGGINISNNSIGSIIVAGAGTTIFYGIRLEGTATAAYTVSNNTIGSTSTANSITSNSNTVLTGIAGAHSGFAASVTNNTIQNLQQTSTLLSTLWRGIELSGSVSNQTISGNTIRDVSSASTAPGAATTSAMMGIFLTGSSTTGNTITLNTIRDLSSTTSGATAISVQGIFISGTPATTITKNNIFNLSTASTSATSSINGIYLFNSSATENIINNMIRLGTGVSSSLNPIVRGIYDNTATGSPTNIYFNSIYIGGTQGSNVVNTACVYRALGNTMDVKDNILWNDRASTGVPGSNVGRHYAIQNTATTGTFTSNYNDLYAPNNGGAVGFGASADRITLGNWQTGTSQDLNSQNSDPKFLDANNATTPNLHINPSAPTVIEGNGLAIGTVTDDFDGDTRASFTPTDIGADAGNFASLDLTPPATSYTTLTNTTSTSNRILTATITDSSGVPTTGVGLPVIYYRKGTSGAFSSSQATFGGGSTYNFTIDYSLVAGGSVAIGDTIQYYVVAQDVAAIPNVSSNPSAGASGFTANPPSASTPPTTPNSYKIGTALSGTKTVCAASCDYDSLTNANGVFDSINSNVVTTNLTINITGNLAFESGAIALNALAEEGAGNYTVTIQPDAAWSVSGSVAGALLKFNGASRVTIDGSINGAGTDRSLTIENTSATSPNVVVFGSIGTTPITNNTLKNCVIRNGATTTSAVVISDSGILGTPGFFSNITIQNNDIQKAFIGVYASGGTNPQNGSNLTYTQNSLNTSGANAIRNIGLYMQGVNGATISQNTVGNFSSSEAENDFGIWLASGTINATVSGNTVTTLGYTGTVGLAPTGINVTSGATGSNVNVTGNSVSNITANGTVPARGIAVLGLTADATVQKNNVQGVINTSTSTFGAYGIDISAGNNIAVRNNFVSNVNHDMSGGFAFSTTFGVFGIRVGSGSNIQVHHNSVNLYGPHTGTAASNLLSAAFALVSTGSQNCDVRDNIFANTISGGTTSIAHVSVHLPSGGTSAMNLTWNNNAYYNGSDAASQGLAQVGTTPGTGFYLSSNFNPAATTPANNFRSYSSTLSAGGTNDNASFASTSAAPFNTNNDLHIKRNSPSVLAAVENVGTPIVSAGNDYDNDPRDATTPDIGADEVTTMQFSSPTYTAAENVSGGLVTITVTRTAGTGSAATINYATVAGGSATGGITCGGATDYQDASGTLSFAAGETSKTFDITICNDGLFENSETVNLALSLATGGSTLGAPDTAVLTITDDEPQPSASIGDVSQNETDSGPVTMSFPVTLSGPSSSPTTINYTTADGTATSPVDYLGETDSIVIPATQTTGTIEITINGDLIYEPNETFTVTITSPDVTIGTGIGTGTILNDDSPVTGATFVVNTTADGGIGICDAVECTLREALIAANLDPVDANTITFNIPNTDPNFSGGVYTISPASQLPAIVGDGTVIDGTSQTAIADTNPAGPEIVLSGAVAMTLPLPFVDGLRMQGANGVVKGLVINGFTTAGFANRGILITGGAATGNKVQGNYIGTDALGTSAVPNGDGVMIDLGSTNNTIGGTGPGEGNVISGNGGPVLGTGVVIQGISSGNSIQGNLIGTDKSGLADLGNSGEGVAVRTAAQGNTIGGTTAAARNVISGNGFAGVKLGGGAGTSLNVVQGNSIGTNITGTSAIQNAGSGVHISDGSFNNTVGGVLASERNILSGNGNGVEITGMGTSLNLIRGNYIGTNAAGTAAVGNLQSGVTLSNGATNNTIGGAAPGAGNVISGNQGNFGIPAAFLIRDNGTSGNTVQGNFIGVAADGSTALGNFGCGAAGCPGVLIMDGASGNTIGGSVAGEGNIIANSNGDGIQVTDGTQPAGTAIGNLLRRNSIYNNGKLGINLIAPLEDGTLGVVTPNDTGDGDTGPNNLQNFPIITTGNTGDTSVSGTLNSSATSAFTIELYSNNSADGSGNGEGQTYLGTAIANTDGTGNGTWTVTPVPALTTGQVLTATATDASNNTSEFSQTYAVVAGAVAADLSITKIDSQDPVTVGDNLTYTITVSNGGPGTATGVQVVDTLPANVTFVSASAGCNEVTGTVTCSLGSINNGANAAVQITVIPTAAAAGTQLSNTATATASEPDPNTPNTATETTNVLAAPVGISINDVFVSEPNAGTSTATFTVTLASPAAGNVTVDYATADGSATAPDDYTAIPTTQLTFTTGQTSQNVSVTIKSDVFTEGSENFFVNLSNPSGNATITDDQGQGTIADPVSAGNVLISEFRFRGAAGNHDEFVELYNNTGQPITVATTDGSDGWTLAALNASGSGADVLVTIPSGTVIPARGHFLAVNNNNTGGYSLEGYAAGDAFYTTDVGDSSGVAIFKTTTPANFTLANRLDAAGFAGFSGATADMYREGAGLISGAFDGEYAYVRKLTTGLPQDTDDNVADFVFVATDGALYGAVQAVLGAPGPENCGCNPGNTFAEHSPVQHNADVKASLIDPAVSSNASPNRERDNTPHNCNGGTSPSNCTQGTLEIRRRFKNNTGVPVTRLRFRVVDVTTFNSPNPGGAQADLRWLTSGDLIVPTSGGPVTARGTVIEIPPAQVMGGGLNSSGVVTIPGGALIPNATIDVRFVLGVQANGRFRFLVNVEALP